MDWLFPSNKNIHAVPTMYYLWNEKSRDIMANKVDETWWYYCGGVHVLVEEIEKWPITNTQCNKWSLYHVAGIHYKGRVEESFTGEVFFFLNCNIMDK